MGGHTDTLWIDVRAQTNERSFREMEQQVESAGQRAGSRGGSAIKGLMGEALGALPGLAMGVAAAVGAALVGGLKTAFDVAQEARSGIREMQGELGITAQEAERLGAVAKTAFAQGWTGSLTEAQEAVKNVRREVQGSRMRT